MKKSKSGVKKTTKAGSKKKSSKNAVKKKTVASKKKPTKKIAKKVLTKPKTKQEKKTRTVVAKKAVTPISEDNKIVLMTVDPWKLFAYWELKQEMLLKTKGVFVLRVYDITGVKFDGRNANIVFDIAIHERIGNSYIGVGPGRAFIVDLGVILHGGGFLTAARSNKATTPPLSVSPEEMAIFSVGYF
ncbi:MAG: DUF4912 domain-containing protein [Nitrospiraceae bacterium]|nr:DUF4912 domain-containing protein [Nitrospiraceae bacterium]